MKAIKWVGMAVLMVAPGGLAIYKASQALAKRRRQKSMAKARGEKVAFAPAKCDPRRETIEVVVQSDFALMMADPAEFFSEKTREFFNA